MFSKISFSKQVALLFAVILVISFGNGVLFAPPPSPAIAPFAFHLLKEAGASIPSNATLLSLAIFEQGATAFSGRRSAEVISYQELGLSNATIFENCFAGFVRKGINFIVQPCPEVKQDICEYDYILIPPIEELSDLRARLVLNALSVRELAGGALLVESNKGACI